MTPAVRAYLQQVGKDLRNVAFFITSGNTDVSRITPSLEALANRRAIASIGFNDRELKDPVAYEKKLSVFVERIRSARQAGFVD
jgi:hypothetical protein